MVITFTVVTIKTGVEENPCLDLSGVGQQKFA